MSGFYHGAVSPPRSLLAASLVLATAAGMLVGCSGGGSGAGIACASAAAAPCGLTATNAAAVPLLPTHVAALPDFDPSTFDRLLSQLRGTPTVVNIWASWCGPCKDEGPALAQAARAYGNRVQFLGFDIQDERAGARSFIDRFGWPYPSIADPDGAIRDDLGFAGVPETVFYGADGTVAARSTGPVTAATLRARIESLL
jgi:cytochrome c biogenesis protein CcmG, thiol:disulfide interchange protein DsbE